MAVDGPDVLGVAEIELPLLDNTRLGNVAVYVPERLRRRRIGSALAEHVFRRLRAQDRRIANAYIVGPEIGAARDPTGGPTAGEAFAARLGLTRRLVDVHRVLELPVVAERLQWLGAEAATRSAGYQLVHWVDRCPQEHVQAYCRLKAAMVAQAPMGDLEVEPEVWDETRLREEEAELTAMGRTHYVHVAVGPDRSLAGHTELSVPAHDPGNVFQWDTLVLPQDRGHRLGLALKVANHARVQAAHPERIRAHTWNAADNPAMVAVNDTLGYRPVEFTSEWQGPVPS